MITLALTPEQFAALKEKAGIPAAQISGTIDQKGVVARWDYLAGLLSVTILKKPALVPESFILNRFKKWANLS